MCLVVSALKQNWSRLFVAGTLSLLLHLALLGVPVNPTGGVPRVVPTIHVRLEPAVDSAPPPREAAPASPEMPAAPAREDARRKPAAAKPGKKRKPAAESISPPAGGLELPLSRDPTYYPAQQLDVYPQPLTPIKLSYPDFAAAQRVDGQLLLRLLIDEFGVVDEASVVESRPEGYFEEGALTILRATRFSPARKQGQPVKSRVLLQVSFTYGDREAATR